MRGDDIPPDVVMHARRQPQAAQQFPQAGYGRITRLRQVKVENPTKRAENQRKGGYRLNEESRISFQGSGKVACKIRDAAR